MLAVVLRASHQTIAILALILIAGLATSAMAGDGTWTTTGPYGGPSNVLVADPTTPATIYEASPLGGVFKSLDGGAHWARASAGLTDPTCYTLAIDPADHDILYTAGGNGIFKSTDGAAHWRQIGSIVNVRQIVIDPKRSATLYAVLSQNSLQKSTDGGRTWVSQFNQLPSQQLNALAIDPVTPTNLYAGAIGGVYKSVNGGKRWRLITAGLGTGFIDVENLWIDPATPANLFAQTAQGVVKSTDGGLRWKPVDTGFSAGNFNMLAIDPSQPATLYGAAFFPSAVFVSRNAGRKWTQLADMPSGFFGFIQTVAVDPTNSANLYVGTGQGVFVSTDRGRKWSEHNAGLSNTPVTAVALDPASPSTVYAATEGAGMFKSLDGGQSWTRQLSMSFKAPAVLIDPTAPNTLYFGDEFGGGIFKSTNAGASWTNVLPSLTVLSLTLDSQSPTVLFAGIGGGSSSIYESINAGKTWHAVGASLPAGFQPVALSADGGTILTADPNVGLYFAAYRSPAGDTSATAQPAVTSRFQECLNAHPSVGKIVNRKLGRGDGAYIGDASLDGTLKALGQTDRGKIKAVCGNQNSAKTSSPAAATTIEWAAPTGVDATDCPPITAIAADPITPSTFYAGGTCGVLKGTQFGAKLKAMNDGLPTNVPVYDLAISPSGKSIYAAVWGGGVYSFTTP